MTCARFGLLAILLIGVLGLMPGVASKGHRNANPAIWRKQTVQILDYTAAGLDGYVSRQVNGWNAALDGALTLVYVREAMVEECAGVQERKGAIVVCSRTSYPEHPAGLSIITYGGRHDKTIKAASVTLVASTYDTNSSDSGYWWHPSGCHELGHVLGLKHPSDWSADTCMGTQRDSVSARDSAAVRKLYRHKR